MLTPTSHGALAELIGRTNCINHALSKCHRRRRQLGRKVEDCKLISSKSGDDIGITNAGPQPSRDGLKKSVTRGVSEGIVHVFELVQVEVQQRQASAIVGQMAQHFIHADRETMLDLAIA